MQDSATILDSSVAALDVSLVKFPLTIIIGGKKYLLVKQGLDKLMMNRHPDQEKK